MCEYSLTLHCHCGGGASQYDILNFLSKTTGKRPEEAPLQWASLRVSHSSPCRIHNADVEGITLTCI